MSVSGCFFRMSSWMGTYACVGAAVCGGGGCLRNGLRARRDEHGDEGGGPHLDQNMVGNAAVDGWFGREGLRRRIVH